MVMRNYLSPLYTLPATTLALMLFLLISVATHMATLNAGQEITIPARGYDPRAILLGHYVSLTPDIEADLSPEVITGFDLGESRWSRQQGWTVMENQNGNWVATHVSKNRPSFTDGATKVALFGDIGFRHNHKRDANPVKITVTPPIHVDRYYANVDEAKALEDILRDQNDETSVKLILSVAPNGTALLKGIEVNGDRKVMSWW